MIWSHRRPDQTTPTAYVFCVLCAPSDFNAHGHASHETHGKIAIHAWFVLIRCMHMMAWVLRCLEANQLRLCQIDIFYIIFNPRIWMTKMPDDGIKWESKLAISIYVDLSPYACDACTCVHQLHNVQVKSGWLRCSKTPPRWLYTLTVYMTLQQQHIINDHWYLVRKFVWPKSSHSGQNSCVIWLAGWAASDQQLLE